MKRFVYCLLIVCICWMTISVAETSTPEIDRIKLVIDQDLLWNVESGILAEGNEAIKKQGTLPYENTTYRKMLGTSVEGEIHYDSRETHTIAPVLVSLSGDYFGMDLPQKSLKVTMAEEPAIINFSNCEYGTVCHSFLLSNADYDGMFTRIADVVQTRLIQECGVFNIITLKWKPVSLTLNDSYWGQYYIREVPDAQTLASFEGVPLTDCGNVEICSTLSPEKTYPNMDLSQSDPAHNADDLSELEATFDIDNLMDWLTIQVFFGNNDDDQLMFYRVESGPWKCVVQDLSNGLLLADRNSLNYYLGGPDNTGRKTRHDIFRKILEVDQYRHLFLTKIGKAMEALSIPYMQSVVDDCFSSIESEMDRHFKRWAPMNDIALNPELSTDPATAYRYWLSRIDRMRNKTIVRRPKVLYGQIQEFFSLTDDEMSQYFSR